MATALKGLVTERDAMIDYAITIQAQADQAMIDLLDRLVDPKLFFRGEVPSILARRRLTKLAAVFGHIVDEFDKYKDKIRDHAHWRTEFKKSFEDLSAIEKQQASIELILIGLTA